MNNQANGIYKQAFLETLIRNAGTQSGKLAARFKQLSNALHNNYVVDAIRRSRIQYAPNVVDNSFTLHGQILQSLEEHGALGAKQIRQGLDKIRMAAETADTGLGAMAIGKRGLETKRGWRYNLFSYRKRNYIPDPTKHINNPFGAGLGVRLQAERPSITAPLEAIGATAVPTMAVLKGNEIIETVTGKKHQGNV